MATTALVVSSNATGYKGVSAIRQKYKAQVRESGRLLHLGTFDTPEEGALAFSRHIGSDRAAAQNAIEGQKKLTVELATAASVLRAAEEARATARAEGLELVRSDNATGYRGVSAVAGKYKAAIKEGSKQFYLGIFGTPERRQRWRTRGA